MAGERLVPAGVYRGKLISVEGPFTSKEKGTPFLNLIGEITEEGDYKGRRLPWTAFLTPNSAVAQRSMQALIGSGWDEKLDKKWTGLGSKEQMFDIGHEEYTPEPTEANPTPKTSTRARINWVNNTARGLAGNAMDAAAADALFASLGGDLAKAKSGSVETAEAADGTKVNKDGKLVGKDNKEYF